MNDSLNSLEQMEFYKLLVNSIQDYAIFLLDVNGKVASWNLGAQKLKGYSADEIIGKHFSIFYTPEDKLANKTEKELEACNQYGHVEDEYWRVKKDGSRFWANVVITALRDQDGKLIGYAKVTRDLTERKKHEDELALANKHLQDRRSALEALNKAKDEFISLASHQLRTPATGVKQFLGMVLDGYAGPLDDKQKQYIMRAYESNDRQIELVNDLLRVAQIDAGKVTLTPTTVDITALIKDVVEEQKDSFKARHQTVTVKTLDSPLYATCDKRRFRMVLENLIDNASKYTPNGGNVKVTTKTDQHTVSVIIKDSGVGIPKEALAHLFGKFSRIPNKLSDDVGGSGLGLYWAHKIIQLHKGDIRVASQVGRGSTFEVIIPKGDVHA